MTKETLFRVASLALMVAIAVRSLVALFGCNKELPHEMLVTINQREFCMDTDVMEAYSLVNHMYWLAVPMGQGGPGFYKPGDTVSFLYDTIVDAHDGAGVAHRAFWGYDMRTADSGNGGK